MNTKKQNGFTILFAVLVSSILLAVGASIFNITVKNLLFSGTGRESLKAFAAADSGLECALYWDENGEGMFGRFNEEPVFSDIASNAQCVGVLIADRDQSGWESTKDDSNNVTTKFSIKRENSIEDVCVDIIVRKIETAPGSGKTRTLIESRGHNTCVVGVRQLERAIKISYLEL